jgi:hypothetical protein
VNTPLKFIPPARDPAGLEVGELGLDVVAFRQVVPDHHHRGLAADLNGLRRDLDWEQVGCLWLSFR